MIAFELLTNSNPLEMKDDLCLDGRAWASELGKMKANSKDLTKQGISEQGQSLSGIVES